MEVGFGKVFATSAPGGVPFGRGSPGKSAIIRNVSEFHCVIVTRAATAGVGGGGGGGGVGDGGGDVVKPTTRSALSTIFSEPRTNQQYVVEGCHT